MTADAIDALYIGLLLILPISALAARRLPVGNIAKMALAWVAIFAAAFLLVVLWQEATGAGTGLGPLPKSRRLFT